MGVFDHLDDPSKLNMEAELSKVAPFMNKFRLLDTKTKTIALPTPKSASGSGRGEEKSSGPECEALPGHGQAPL